MRTNFQVNSKKNGTRGWIQTKKAPTMKSLKPLYAWLRGPDLNQRPSGYEPDELPDCSTPRRSG